MFGCALRISSSSVLQSSFIPPSSGAFSPKTADDDVGREEVGRGAHGELQRPEDQVLEQLVVSKYYGQQRDLPPRPDTHSEKFVNF